VIPGAVLLASVCWAITFALDWGNFWMKIGCSVLLVCCYSCIWKRPRVVMSSRSVTVGLCSATLLYGIFFLGHTLSPYVIPGAHADVRSIYVLGAGTSRLAVLLLLLFITGPGEEIFWRGFLQESLMQRWGSGWGFLAGTLVYTCVHVFSLNLMLILAALVAGGFWGLLYLWKRDLTVQIVSHAVWTGLIFAVAPIS
jgi:hypothetical protein